MGKKFRILICGNEAGRVEHNDIVELEEIQEEKKETLADKLYKENQGYRVTSSSAITLERIAKEHFQSHPEELGLVRIEDVLKTVNRFKKDGIHYAGRFILIDDISQAIEGMKHGNT